MSEPVLLVIMKKMRQSSRMRKVVVLPQKYRSETKLYPEIFHYLN